MMIILLLIIINCGRNITVMINDLKTLTNCLKS